MVKRLRHRPFTAVTRVRFPLESLEKEVRFTRVGIDRQVLSNSFYIKLVQALIKCSRFADVAQLAEQLICNQQVIGSSPIIGFVPDRDRHYMDL